MSQFQGSCVYQKQRGLLHVRNHWLRVSTPSILYRYIEVLDKRQISILDGPLPLDHEVSVTWMVVGYHSRWHECHPNLAWYSTIANQHDANVTNAHIVKTTFRTHTPGSKFIVLHIFRPPLNCQLTLRTKVCSLQLDYKYSNCTWVEHPCVPRPQFRNW